MKNLLALLFVFVLAGCSSLAVNPETAFEDAAVAIIGGRAAVQADVSDGSITEQQAAAVNELLNQAAAALGDLSVLSGKGRVAKLGAAMDLIARVSVIREKWRGGGQSGSASSVIAASLAMTRAWSEIERGAQWQDLLKGAK